MSLRGFLTAPIRILHELTHVLAALPWAEEWQIIIEPGYAEARVAWDEHTPGWGVAIASLAPALVGALLASVVLVSALLEGFPLPATAEAGLWWALGGVAWALYAAPSPGDLQGATEAIRDE